MEGADQFSTLTPGAYDVSITDTPEDITCPTETKSTSLVADDTVDVDWTCEGSSDTTVTSSTLTPGQILPL